MNRALCIIIMVCLITLILACLGLWIYSKDIFFLGIGVLLAIALLLVSLEFKKIRKDPFS